MMLWMVLLTLTYNIYWDTDPDKKKTPGSRLHYFLGYLHDEYSAKMGYQ